MSYNQDVYSRRPTDDDRRAADHRDRRRDSFPRAVPDATREDRYRRDTATSNSTKGRRNPLEFTRDQPSVAKPAKPHSHADVGSGRPDHGARAVSTSRSPADSPVVDRNTACEKLSRLCETIISLARLKAERDPLDKVLKQRQAEYERSRVKHAEFPSVPEVQNMHRVKYADRIRSLDAQIQKFQEEIHGTIESVVQAITQSGESEPKAVAPAVPFQQREAAKKQQEEIGELKTKIRQIEADRARDRTELAADFSRQLAEMKQQAEETIKGMKEEVAKELKSIKISNDDMAGEMREQMGQVAKVIKNEVKEEVTGKTREQLRAMRGEFEKRQTEQGTSQQNDLLSRLAKHKEELTESVDQQLSAHRRRNSPETASSTAKSTLIQQTDVSSLESRIDQETATLRGSIASIHQQLADQCRKVEEHESKLSNLDTDALDQAAETMSIEFPKLQKGVMNVQTKVDGILQEIDSRQKALKGQVKEFTGSAIDHLARLIDSTGTNHDARIRVLEQADSVNSETVALFKSDFETTKAAVDQLSQELLARGEDVAGQLSMIRHTAMSLETRFNNLTTKAVAEYVIGHLEQLYPNSHQLIAEIVALKTLMEGLLSRIASLENCAQGFKDNADNVGEPKFDASEVSRMQDRLMKELNENGRLNHNKRKRANSGLNGADQQHLPQQHLPTNGIEQTYGD